MTMRRVMPMLILGTVLLSTGVLRAADLTFFVGGTMPGSVSYRNVKTSLSNSPVYGVRVGTNFVPALGMEHTLAFSSDYLFPENVSSLKDARGFVYNSNLMVNLPVRVLSAAPYFTIGLGLLHQYGIDNSPVGSKFAVNYGGGLKFSRVAGPLGLRFDVRGYRAGIFSDKMNLFEASGGILISLGRE